MFAVTTMAFFSTNGFIESQYGNHEVIEMYKIITSLHANIYVVTEIICIVGYIITGS